MTNRFGVKGTYLDLYPKSEHDPTIYERASITSDICICRIQDKQLQILLVKRKEEYPSDPEANKWAIPGGFVHIEEHETSEETAYRKLREKTGIKSITLRQLQFYDAPYRDSRWRIASVVYFALVSNEKLSEETIVAGSNAADVNWFDVRNLPDMAFDHAIIIDDLHAKLQILVSQYPIAFELLPKEFSWQDLQNVYESILNRSLVAPNFRRKIETLYKLSFQEKSIKPPKGRPAKLLRFHGEKTNF